MTRGFLFSLFALACLAVRPAKAQVAPPAAGLTVEAVAANRQLWPRQVITKAPASVVIVANGQPAGSLTLPAGALATLKRVEGSMVHLEVNGSAFTLPAAQTDLLAGASTMQARLLAAPAARPGAPQPGTVPASTGQRVIPLGAKDVGRVADNSLGASIQHDLVSYRNNAVTVQNGDGLRTKKYLALYFSAHWCGPCRQFTPKLVAWYQSRRAQADQFEIVFVSHDRSSQEMAAYLREDQMPWPAIDYTRRATIEALDKKYAGKGIPCLVLIDERGEVVSHSYDGARYLGPQHVLRELGNRLDAPTS